MSAMIFTLLLLAPGQVPTTTTATAGLSRTAGQQIVDRFDELAASTVDVQPATVPGGMDGTKTVVVGNPMGWDAAQRVNRLAGVDGAATLSDLELPEGETISAVPVIDPSAAPRDRKSVV